MQKRTLNILGVLLLSVMGSLTTLAQAVAQHPPEPPARPDIAKSGGNGAALEKDGEVRTSTSIGWVYVHPNHCEMYNGTLYVYTVEGWRFWTSATSLQDLIETDCQFGNYLAFYIYDYSNDWDAVYTYNFK